MRRGCDARIEPEPITFESRHKLLPVYREMLLQICRDYPGLPDPRTLTMGLIRFFYEGLRAELHKRTAPSKK